VSRFWVACLFFGLTCKHAFCILVVFMMHERIGVGGVSEDDLVMLCARVPKSLREQVIVAAEERRVSIQKFVRDAVWAKLVNVHGEEFELEEK